MDKKFFRNIGINFFVTFSVGILGFVINQYFATYMGIDNLGLMKLFTQMIVYLNLAELGLAEASSYALYKPLRDKDISMVNTIISTINSFYKNIALIVFVCGLGINFIIPYFINIAQHGKDIYLYWTLYVLNTSISYFFAKYSILFTANQEYGFVRIIQGSGKIIFQILQIFILMKTKSFTLFIFMITLENLYNYYFYKKHYQKNYDYLKGTKQREKSILVNMKKLLYHRIGGLIVFNTDYIVLSKFTTLSIVATYSSYLMIYQMAVTIMNIPTSVLRPAVGIFVARSKKEESYKYWRELYGVYFAVATIFVISIYILIIPFIKLWLGERFILSKLTIVLILINLFIHLTRMITDIFKDSFGFFEDIYSPILESGINLILSLILVRKLGLNGVIIGTMTSNIIVIFLLKPILVLKRCFEKNILDYLVIILKLSTLSALSIGIILNLINILNVNLIEISSWSSLIYQSFIIGILSTIVIILVFLLDVKFREFLIKKIELGVVKYEKIFWNK